MKILSANLQTFAAIASVGAVLVSLAACSEKPKSEIKTMETEKAQGAVDAYELTGSQELKLKAEKAFLNLDREIKELELRAEAATGEKKAEATARLAQLKTRESEIRANFNEAKFNVLLQDVKESIR